jgi:LacI family transcriptional regulator
MVKFEQIARDLTAEILAGLHGSPGDRFMTVRELADRFGVALTTAQKAVKRIKAEGLLIGDSTSPAKIAPAAVLQSNAESAVEFSPRRLGLVVTDITNPFFSRVCRDVQRAAGERQLQVLVGSSDSDFERERKLIEGFLEIGVEGLLICPGLDDACTALYSNLIDRGVRLLFVSRRVAGVEVDFVVAHNFVGGAAVAGHLLSLGYDSFGYIGFGPRLKRDERLQGFRSALDQEGIELAADRITDGDGRDIIHGYRAMQRLFDCSNRPRAVFTFNDLLAIGALQYCQEQDIAVPDDVAIAGFDNLPQCRVTSPALTSVAYPVESIARLAVQNLVDRIEGSGEHPPHRILLEPHLVVRQSTDPQVKTDRSSVATEEETTESV